MKLLLPALLLAAATAAFPQLQRKPSPPAQPVHRRDAPCPITFTQAGFSSPSRNILPIGQKSPETGSLNLRFHNDSGRDIRSASITAWMRVKTSLYDLDARPIEFHLTFSSIRDLDAAMTQLAHIPLPEHVYPYGVSRVQLDQVIFADGTLWTASAGSSCQLTPADHIEQIGPAGLAQ